MVRKLVAWNMHCCFNQELHHCILELSWTFTSYWITKIQILLTFVLVWFSQRHTYLECKSCLGVSAGYKLICFQQFCPGGLIPIEILCTKFIMSDLLQIWTMIVAFNSQTVPGSVTIFHKVASFILCLLGWNALQWQHNSMNNFSEIVETVDQEFTNNLHLQDYLL